MGTQSLCLYALFTAGQKITYGQGLEGPWERPPPLDEPQRDESSEDTAALSGEAWCGMWGGQTRTLVGGARP
jgi:hypothetical protein